MNEQLGHEFVQTKDDQRLIQRKSLAPGLGDSYQQPANPHRAGHYGGLHSEDQPHWTDNLPNKTQGRVLAQDDGPEEDETYYVTRPHTSARRYDVTGGQTIRQGNKTFRYRGSLPQDQLPPQRQVYTEPEAEQPPTKPRKRMHWLGIFGVGMIAMLAIWTGLSMLGSWWQVHQDDLAYGRPRTFQTDAVVGHNNDSASNPSHFIAINLNRHILIIELPAGDSTKAKIYNGPTLFGDGQDLTPVTLTFQDLNGDALPDMVIHVQDQTLVMINDQGSFRSPKQGEQIHV